MPSLQAKANFAIGFSGGGKSIVMAGNVGCMGLLVVEKSARKSEDMPMNLLLGPTPYNIYTYHSGMRAATFALGALRGLHINGQLKKARYITSSSGVTVRCL